MKKIDNKIRVELLSGMARLCNELHNLQELGKKCGIEFYVNVWDMASEDIVIDNQEAVLMNSEFAQFLLKK